MREEDYKTPIFFFHSKVTTTWIILARIWVSVWDRTWTPWNTISATFGWSCFYERKTQNVCSNSQVGSLSCWCLVLREIFPLFQRVLVTLFAILSLSLFPFLFNLCSLLLFYLPHLPFFLLIRKKILANVLKKELTYGCLKIVSTKEINLFLKFYLRNKILVEELVCSHTNYKKVSSAISRTFVSIVPWAQLFFWAGIAKPTQLTVVLSQLLLRLTLKNA